MPFVPKILIIDDDPRMCDSLKVLLGSEGYEIQTRHNGQEALKALVKNDFDFVLLDLVLPDINGAEIMDHINSQTPETFVIVITGHASLDSAIDSFRKGAFDYLRKPFEYEELLKRVKNALDQKQLKREKKRVKETLRESEEKFRLAFENAKDAIFWANPQTGLIANCNKAAEILIEKTRDEIIGQHQTTLHPSQKAQQYGDMFRRHIERKGSVDEEAEVITKSGKTIPVHITASVTSVGGIPIIQGIFRDVSERKRAEKALRESEQKYNTLVENSLTGIYIDHHGKIVFANNKVAEIYKYSRDELIGMESWKLVHPEDRALTNEIRAKRLNGEDAPREYEARGLTKDGETIWLGRRNTRIEYKGSPAILGNIANITQRKRTEEALGKSMHRMHVAYDQSMTYARELKEKIAERKQAEETLFIYHEKLRSLASKLSLAEERQRRRVAIDVHDHIAQNLAFAKMKLGTLRASMASGGALETMDDILRLVDETIRDTRALISELGSPILYELGFVPALEWLTQQIQKQHGIVVDFDDDGQPKPLSEDVCVALFQAARELLVNIAKHAKARNAKVSIARDGDQVRVDVEDDGVGFDSAGIGSSMDTTGRFGLFSIRVRLEPLGGDMKVGSKPGHGTRVTLVAPLKHKGGNKKEKVS